MSLVLVRVDDRLIHGQVLLAWGPRLSPERYVVVDDGLANDPFERSLVAASAGEIPVEALPAATAAERLAILSQVAAPCVVLVRGLPEAAALARALLERDVPLPSINLGGLHYAPGKTREHDLVYLDRADRAALATLADLGVRVVVQDVPSTVPFDVPADWLEESA